MPHQYKGKSKKVKGKRSEETAFLIKAGFPSLLPFTFLLLPSLLALLLLPLTFHAFGLTCGAFPQGECFISKNLKESMKESSERHVSQYN
jgi:hypothetical protein